MKSEALLQEMLREDKVYIERVIPYAQAGIIQLVREKGELVSEEYRTGRNRNQGICSDGGIWKTITVNGITALKGCTNIHKNV